MPDNSIEFETALKELENIVAQLETGDLNLTDSLKNYERGIQLTRNCQEALQQAEQKIHILSDKDGDLKFMPFEPKNV